jgi:hypothetical protein
MLSEPGRCDTSNVDRNPAQGCVAQPRSHLDLRGTCIRPAQYCGPDTNCIHYRIEWGVTINNQEVSQDTEEDLNLAPSSFWQLSLEKKLEKVLRRKTVSHRRVTDDDTVIIVLTSDRTKRKLTKRFGDNDIIWTAIEKQLVMLMFCFEVRSSR